MICFKNLTKLISIYIDPKPLVLQDHVFRFVHTVEKRTWYGKKVSKTYNNVVLSSPKNEIVLNFSKENIIPEKTTINCINYYNIQGRCLVLNDVLDDGITYKLIRLPRIKINKSGDVSDMSFRSTKDAVFYIKSLLGTDEDIYQNVDTCELITNISEYLINLVENGK